MLRVAALAVRLCLEWMPAHALTLLMLHSKAASRCRCAIELALTAVSWQARPHVDELVPLTPEQGASCMPGTTRKWLAVFDAHRACYFIQQHGTGHLSRQRRGMAAARAAPAPAVPPALPGVPLRLQSRRGPDLQPTGVSLPELPGSQ